MNRYNIIFLALLLGLPFYIVTSYQLDANMRQAHSHNYAD